MNKLTINLDGSPVKAAPGSTLLEIARAQGIEIPTLCYDPRLPPYASCFICIVEVEGRRGMVPACATRAEEGMVVRTNTESIRKLRKLGLELLLSNHHGDCTAPCNMVCPAGIDIRSYLSEAIRGNFSDSLRIIKERNPFPSVCGRICPHPCEDHCRRKLVDDAVSINQVKRFISDRDRCSVNAWKPDVAPANGKKIAVIGGGPGGMSAAHYLAVLGYSVTVFEAMEKAGGMLRYGVPDYRLPPLVIDSEIEQIQALGVELRTGKAWGKDFRLADLRKKGFSATVVAIGAWTGQAMGVEGEDRAGVCSGIAMLEKANKGEQLKLGKKVVVVGGGNTAIDCARTALRHDAEEVFIVYRRSRAEMPANPEEIHEAEEEGIKMLFLTAPVSFSGSGKTLNMHCVKMRLGEPDASGRRRPEPVPGSELVIAADSVIAAIGQKVRWDGLAVGGPAADGLKLTKWGTPEADPKTLRSTSHPDVFVCGDCLTGPATAIEAIAGGRIAALSIHAQLSGLAQDLSPHPFNIRKGALKDLSPAEYAHHPKKPRTKTPQLDAFSRARSCNEVSKTLAEAEAVEEAKRCLLCGCQEVETCRLRRYSEQYGAKGELFPGEKTPGVKMPEHPYIARDHQKCILCGRCVRVCTELQGSGAIGLAGRGFVTEVTPAWTAKLSEYACKSCGQCVAACPAGALSARFKGVNVPAWRAARHSAVCPYCGIGCVLNFSVADDRIQRLDNKIDASPANSLVCSRAFSGFDLLELDQRLKEPMLKEKGSWHKAKWDAAMKAAAEGLKKNPGKPAAVLGSPRLTNEAQYLLQKIGRAALGTNNLGGPGVGGELAAVTRAFGFNASTATVEDLGKADLLIAALPDLEASYPSIAAALREAAVKGAKVRTWPAGIDRAEAARISAELLSAKHPVIITDPSLVSGKELAELTNLLIRSGKPEGLLLLRARSNSQGAIDQGLDGGWLPGHLAVSDKAARAALEKLWGRTLPAWEGLSGPGIIAAARAGGVKSLLSWGDTGLDGMDLKGAFAVSGEWTIPSGRHPASVVFPAALFSEDAGSFTSFDRKVKQSPGWRPQGAPQPNWLMLSDLAKHLGLKGYETISALRREISSANKLYHGLGWEKWEGGNHCAEWTPELSPVLLDPELEDTCTQARNPEYFSKGDMLDKFIRARLGEVAVKKGSMLRKSLLLLFLLAMPGPAYPLTPSNELQRLALRQKAVKAAAWSDSYWLKLLYYEKSMFGRYRSPSVNPKFFLAKWGKISPRLELEAAIDGLYFEGMDDASPECLFPERYRWLKEKLSLSTTGSPPRACPAFENWKAGIDPESVSLLFAAGYLNNLSTLYGHTFLRLHKRGAAGADLLDYTINYAATADEENGLFFAIKGLVGAYPGQFSTIPYYLKIQEYHNMENRDLWEFPLSLNQQELDRLLRHSWELGKAAFPYLFFTRNCSWQLMPLLDIVKPELDLSRRFRYWAIPSDTAKAVLEASPPAAAGWRPSLWKTVEWKRAQLSGTEQTSVLELARGDQTAGLKKLESWSPDRKAAVLEAAADYLSWRFYARRIGKAELDNRTDPLLAARAQLGEQPTFTGGPARPPSILNAHESLRLGAGLVSLRNGPTYEIQARFAVQDLLDDPAGYLPDAVLEMGSFRLRHEPRYNRYYIKEGRLARVLSLNPWDDWVRRRSWEISAGVEQADETGRQSGRSAIWAMSAASGYALEFDGPVRQLWYAMLQAESGFGPALDANWRAGAGLKAGLLASKGPVRALFEARYISYALGDTRPLWAGSAAASLRLAKNSSARLEYAWRGKVKEGGIYFHQFLFAP